MAIFNPPVTDVPPKEYTSYSRAIAPPEEDKSSAILLKGLGDLIGASVATADIGIRGAIDKGLESVEKEKEGYSLALERLAGMKDGVNIQQQSAYGGLPAQQTEYDKTGLPLNLIEHVNQPAPSGLERGLNRIRVASAAADVRKVDHAEFLGKVTATVKQLVNTYGPGYRDYIVGRASKITGMDIADGYIRALTSRINAGVGAENKSKIEGLLLDGIKKGYPLGPIYQGWAAGAFSDKTAVDEYSKYAIQERTEEEEDKAVRRAQGNIELQKARAKQDLSTMVSKEASNHFYDVEADGDGPNANKMNDLARQYREGKAKMDSQTAERFGDYVEQQKQDAYQKLLRRAKERGHVNLLGLEYVDKEINQGLRLYDIARDAFKNKETGVAFAAQRMIDGLASDEMRRLVTDPTEVGDQARLMLAMKGMGSELQTKFFNFWFEDQPKYRTAINTFLSNRTGKMIVQPDKDIKGEVETLSKTVKRMKQANISLGSDLDKVVENVIDGPGGLLDPTTSPDKKVGVARALFDHSGHDLLSEFKSNDNTNSRSRLYVKLTTNRTADMVKQIDTYDPGIWQAYQDFVKTSFGRNIYAEELADLRDAKLEPGQFFSWDDKNQRLTLNDSKGLAVNLRDLRSDPHTSAQTIGLSRSVNRLNDGFRALSYAAKLEGVDPNAYILGFLRDFTVDLTNIDNIPADMLRTIINQNLRNQKKEKSE